MIFRLTANSASLNNYAFREINSGDLSSKVSDVAHNLEDDLAFADNDQEPELEALMDKEPGAKLSANNFCFGRC